MKKLSLYIFLGLMFVSSFAKGDEIIIHTSVDVYNRYKIEKHEDNNKVNLASDRVSTRLREVISARGLTASIGKTTSEIKSPSVMGHFHINLEVVVYPDLNLTGNGEETFVYLTSKRCDGDVFHIWATWTIEKAIDIVISEWDDYALSKNLDLLKKCPFKFPAIKSID